MEHGLWLKEIRIKSGQTQLEFAERIGLTREALGLYERNARPIGKATAIILNSFLKEKDIPVSYKQQYKAGQNFSKVVEALKEQKNFFPEIEFKLKTESLYLKFLGCEIITDELVDLLVEKYNVNKDFLYNGQSPIFFDSDSQDIKDNSSLLEQLNRNKSEIEALKTRVSLLEKFILNN